MSLSSTLLDSLQIHSLSHLLTALRSRCMSFLPFSSLLHLPSLASSPGPSHIPALDAHSPLNFADVVEIQGPPATGKTHLLYHLLINCIIPVKYSTFHLDGWDKAAVIIDTDMTFNVQRFNILLQQRLKRKLPHASEEVICAVAHAALKRLHVFRPHSSTQLAATILNIPKYHADRLKEDQLGLLAIDSISAFYWPDRYMNEQMQLAGTNAQSYTPPLCNVLSALQSLRLSHGPVIILTNWALVADPSSLDSPVPLFKQHLYPFPAPFSSTHPAHIFTPLNAPHYLLPLHYHITLSSGSVQLYQGDNITDNTTEHFSGMIRVPGSSKSSIFTMKVHGDGIDVV